MDHPLVEVETTIAASPRMVWDTIVGKPSTLFMGAKVKTDWKVGHPISMSGDFNGKSFEDTGEIRSFEAEHELSFTHVSGASKDGNLVTLVLEPKGQGTKLRVSQTPMGAPRVNDEQKAKFAKTWATMLDAVKKDAEAASH